MPITPTHFINRTAAEMEAAYVAAVDRPADLTGFDAEYPKLDPRHEAYLTSRGVSAPVAAARGYLSVTPSTSGRVSEHGAWSPAQKAHFATTDPATKSPIRSLLIPLYPLHDSEVVIHPTIDQVRCDVARKVTEPVPAGAPRGAKPKERVLKFEFPAYEKNGKYGEDDQDADEDVVLGRRGEGESKIPVDFNPMVQRGLTAETVIVVTEGVVKGDAIMSFAQGLNVAAISLTGVTAGFHAPGTAANPTAKHTLVEGLASWGDKLDGWAGWNFVLAFDGDWFNPMVSGGILRTARLLEAEGATVRILRLPEVEGMPTAGIDDVLAQSTASNPLRDLLMENVITVADFEMETRRYEATDLGRAQRLADDALHNNLFRYLIEANEWIGFDKTAGVWNLGEGGRLLVQQRVKQLTRRDVGSERFASSSAKAVSAAMTLAKSEPGIAVSLLDFDKDPWELNVPNGVVDLRTGELRERCDGELFAHSTGLAYNPELTDADAPTWIAFLETVFSGDREVIRWFQKWAGYGAVGSANEEVLLIMSGTGGKNGSNGKTTVLKALGEALGGVERASSYAGTLTASVLTGGAKDEMFSSLQGLRFAMTAETQSGATLDDQALKVTCSTDPISARQLHQRRITFNPTHSTGLITNHPPILLSHEHGTTRRLLLLEMKHLFKNEDKDVNFSDRLRLELPAILAWIIRGAAMYAAEGLSDVPTVITEASKRYHEDGDILAEFIADYLVVGDDVDSKKYMVVKDQLVEAFSVFCLRQNQKPWKATTLITALKERGLVSGTSYRSNSKTWVLNVALKVRDVPEPQPEY